MLKTSIIISYLSLTAFSGMAQITIPLYNKDKVPNSIAGLNSETADTAKNGHVSIRHVYYPTLTAYLPSKENASGAAVIICPGGGYSRLASTHEGHDVAREFNKIGVAAFVLKYRLPDDKIMVNKEIGPLQDAQQAIKLVREQAKEWNINEFKIGISGFSAGGHLASTAGTLFTTSLIENKENTSLRPDFMILIYPVISFTDSVMHKGSRDNLLGTSPLPETCKKYASELQVSKETPPTFLVHAGDDKTVKVANSILFYEALLKKGVSAEIHLYPKGGHGFGLNNPSTSNRWFDLCKDWMLVNGWL